MDFMEMIEGRNGRASTIIASNCLLRVGMRSLGEETIAAIRNQLVYSSYTIERKGGISKKKTVKLSGYSVLKTKT